MEFGELSQLITHRPMLHVAPAGQSAVTVHSGTHWPFTHLLFSPQSASAVQPGIACPFHAGDSALCDRTMIKAEIITHKQTPMISLRIAPFPMAANVSCSFTHCAADCSNTAKARWFVNQKLVVYGSMVVCRFLL
jgi:hypothetical protein